MRQYGFWIALILCVLSASCASENKTPKSSIKLTYWDTKKENCDSVLLMPMTYDLQQVVRCTRLWEMYRYVEGLSIKERSRYAMAFSRVSYEATNPYDRSVADAALTRLCIPKHPRDANGEIHEEIPSELNCAMQVGDIELAISKGVEPCLAEPWLCKKRTVMVEEVSAKEAQVANGLYKKAMTARKKKDLGQAIKLYKEALRANPFHVGAKYDLACALAVDGMEDAAIDQLKELYTWDDDEAEHRFVKARTDEDFISIRDTNTQFKKMTGYVKITLLNCACDVGVEHVQNLKQKLESRHFTVSEVAKCHGDAQLKPAIYYHDGFEDTANQIFKAISNEAGNIEVKKDPSESASDIVVMWGQKEAYVCNRGGSDPIVHNKDGRAKEKSLTDSVNETSDSINKGKQSADKFNNSVNSLAQ